MDLARRAYHWTIGTYTTWQGIPRETRLSLDSLGYRLVSPSDSQQELDDNALECDLRLVDDRQIERVPSPEDDPDTPIIALTGPRPRLLEDRRVMGSIERPAQLQALYAILQDALELTPRSSPRIATELAARCVISSHGWPGAVLSLSTKGCLLRSDAELECGMQLNLQFVIPSREVITTRAHCVSTSGVDAGLVFCDPSLGERETINHYIVDQLTER
ncbi:MAG: PilZ domain-containing protein [Deltaproteobacteria bacterium]|nr:PilZ domain-containing protein [Deltaproteobacteria bacterium]MBW2418438.1 PilZ domain-containing protein [Deltaproteobacteria bacterium]